MGKLSYITDFEANVALIEEIKKVLDDLCNYQETDSFKMGKKDGASNTYMFILQHKGYTAKGEISVKEVYERCNTCILTEAGRVIRELIDDKYCSDLKKRL